MWQKEKIVVWGSGHIARNFIHEKGYQYDIQYIIDNYEPKYKIKNFMLYKPDEVDLERYKIVIAVADWKSIAEQLETLGLSFYHNYLPYNILNRDEIPIMEILSRINDSEVREDAISAYQCGRKIALINGNCQTSRIKMYLQQNRAFYEEYVFLDVPALFTLSQDEKNLLMQHSDIFKKVALFISQSISVNNAFDYRFSNEYLIELMDKSVRYIRIPNLFFDIYFPQGGKEQDPKKETFLRDLFPYNDAVIDELVDKPGFEGRGYTTDEIIEIIKMENFYTDDFLEWVVQYRLKQLKERESVCDIKMMDYIENNYLKEQLFYSRNHPTNKVLKEESVRILKYINPAWSPEIEHEETIPSLSINQEFIYPSVHFKLKLMFRKRWYSDTLSECSYTIEEEIKKYLFCCHNRSIESLKEDQIMSNAVKTRDWWCMGGGRILFVNHKSSRCGVYEFGRNVFRCIKNSVKYKFIYVEVDSFQELLKEVVKYRPGAIIYNYMLTTMPWSYKRTEKEGIFINRLYDIPCVQIGMIHAVEQFVADEASGRKKYVSTRDYNKLFDYYIAPDPTLLLKNPLVYKTGRPLIKYKNRYVEPRIPSFGTAGLAKTNVGYIRFVEKVQEEYDEAIIKINIPKGTFADNCFHKIAKELEGTIYKQGIKLELTRKYFTTKELLDFLAQNTANFFLYENGARRKREARGISSSLDNALSVRRPVILSNDTMYKHVLQEVPHVDINKMSIHEIIERGFEDLEVLYNAWQPECMQWEYERIIEDIFSKIQKTSLKTFIKTSWMGGGQTVTGNSWAVGLKIKDDDMTPVKNTFPICEKLDNVPYNRILDDFSREAYKDILDYMKQLLPNNMNAKLERANVQQAFVVNTVIKLSSQFSKASILCVGCFTDTAYLTLKKCGIQVVGIDPAVNYDLKTFLDRPDQQGQKYHIIFSTSVIEHVEDDEEFVRDIAARLEDNGYFIMTCDYKDGYVEGDPKPGCDFRFYTEYDLKTRLISNMPGCDLLGECDWADKENDFDGGGIMYSFASFVAQKVRC